MVCSIECMAEHPMRTRLLYGASCQRCNERQTLSSYRLRCAFNDHVLRRFARAANKTFTLDHNRLTDFETHFTVVRWEDDAALRESQVRPHGHEAILTFGLLTSIFGM